MNKPDFTKFKRDENGLLPNVEYVFKENGYVDWRAMVSEKFLGVKKDKQDTVKKKYGDLDALDLRIVDDQYLFVLLGGIKELAQIRGIRSVKQKIDFASDRKAVATCEIEFIGNYETNSESLIFSDSAAASDQNVHKDFCSFLESIAANRAFTRCVRNALSINIVGKDELSSTGTSSEDLNVTPDREGFDVNTMLKEKCSKKSISFEKMKENVIANYSDKMSGEKPVEEWNDWSDIPNKDCFFIADKLNKK